MNNIAEAQVKCRFLKKLQVLMTNGYLFLLSGLCLTFSTQLYAQIQFEDITQQSGVIYSGESYGGSWGDMNGDGWPDLFVNNHRNRPDLFVNNGDGTFVNKGSEITTWQNVPRSDTHGGSWSDFDNDGDQDLYITAGAKNTNQFFVNEASGLVDRTAIYDPGNAKWRARLPVWFDYNNDGFLDFIMASENFVNVYEQSASTFIDKTLEVGFNCGATQKMYLSDFTVGGPLELVCASGNFPKKMYSTDTIPFANVTSQFTSTGYVLEAAIADYNGDLRPDVFLIRGKQRISQAAKVGNNAVQAHLITGSSQKSFSFKNAGNITVKIDWDGQPFFNNIRNKIFIGSTGINPASTSISLSSSDPDVWGIKPHVPGTDHGIYIGYDNIAGIWTMQLSPKSWDQAFFDITSNRPVSNVKTSGRSRDELPMQPKLRLNLPGGFKDRTVSSGLGAAIKCVSTVAGDFDNDMDMDIYVVCRDGVTNLSNRLYENQGDGTFVQVPGAGGAAGIVGAGRNFGTGENVVLADYDLNGFLDLFVTNGLNMVPAFKGGPNQLFRNMGNGNNWIEFDLAGVSSNRDGIGAKVYATAGGVTQLREQNGGYHRWAQNHQRIHYGLAQNSTVDLRIEWPSGTVDRLQNVPANQLYRITEGVGYELTTPGAIKSVGINDVVVDESAGTANFTVSLSIADSQPVTMDVATANGTATAPGDYSSVTSTLTFAPGETSKTVSVNIVDDSITESAETFSVNLSNVTNATVGNATGTGTITDNDLVCGPPGYDGAVDGAIFLWTDCSTGQWRLRSTAGSLGNVRFTGNLVSDQAYTNVVPVKLENSDILDTTNPNRIDFTLEMWSPWEDGFNFNFPTNANVCLRVSTPANVTVFVGPNRTSISPPFDLTTLGACN